MVDMTFLSLFTVVLASKYSPSGIYFVVLHDCMKIVKSITTKKGIKNLCLIENNLKQTLFIQLNDKFRVLIVSFCSFVIKKSIN